MPNTGVFVALNASKRNSSRLLSVTAKERNNETSRALFQSERRLFRPIVPNVKGAGTAKAFGLNGCRCVTPAFGSPTTSARSAPKKLLVFGIALSALMLYGKPLEKDRMPLNCQPPTIWFRAVLLELHFCPLPNGNG